MDKTKDNIPAHWFPITEPDKDGKVAYCCSKCRSFASQTYDKTQKVCMNCNAKMVIYKED